jgi:hypothetical protein
MKKMKFLLIYSLLLISPKLAQCELFAGIEVGSKGVKMNIINVETGSQRINYTSVFDTTINTDFISFTGSSYMKTLEGLTALYLKSNTEYKVYKENTFVAFSSGVQQTAIKENKASNVESLLNSFKIAIGEPNREVEILTVNREAVLSHKGIIPMDNKMTSILIDIGSGNTKGGYYITESIFNTFVLPWGTKSMYNSIDKLCDSNCNSTQFYNALTTKLDYLDQNEFSKTIDKYGIKNYDFNIVFSGGIVWSVANLMYPNKVKEKNIEISTADLNDFYHDLNYYFDDIKTKSFSPEFDKEKAKILKTFTQRNLIAGTGLMLKVMKQFEQKNNFKKFQLAKDTKVSWITAYIIEQIEQKQLSISK